MSLIPELRDTGERDRKLIFQKVDKQKPKISDEAKEIAEQITKLSPKDIDIFSDSLMGVLTKHSFNYDRSKQ